MGNSLTSYAPSSVHSVEEYISALPAYEREQNLGLTRFLKTVKVKSTSCHYPLVAKVFVRPEKQDLTLTEQGEKIDEIRYALAECPNVLPFSEWFISEKSAIVLRQFIKYSLYERMSTRPFLTNSEKKWIAFQSLRALEQCHSVGVCHGDIKLENIMITGWNWVSLTDFASFKPTLLKRDDPSYFLYFFDTSRRQVCCIAPERFQDTSGDHLTTQMDIFSLGCVFIELFSDGKSFFNLAEIQNPNYDRIPRMENIEDPGLRRLCAHMIQRDPAVRSSADVYLAMTRSENIFPPFFDGLFDYLKEFAMEQSHPDSKIFKLLNDHESDGHAGLRSIRNEADGNLALINFITATLRSLKHSTAKRAALKLLRELPVSAGLTLDRLLPFMLHMLSDSDSLVRSESISLLTRTMSQIQGASKHDSSVFVEYILPELTCVSADNNSFVRATLAANLATLAETALRLLETAHLTDTSKDAENNALPQRILYEREMEQLHQAMQKIVGSLISDNCNLVKRTLLERGATRLCVFFGQERAHDVFLSHMVTFLNDSSDHQLRCSFFKSVIGVAAFVGMAVTQILIPLIEQGFQDTHDTVVCSALKCVTALAEVRFFREEILCELFSKALPLLADRNNWIRIETANFLSSVARNVPRTLTQCRLSPKLKQYLVCPAVRIEYPETILGCLNISLTNDFSSVDSLIERVQTSYITLPDNASKNISLKIPPNAHVLSSAELMACRAIANFRKIQEQLNRRRLLAQRMQAVRTNEGYFSQAWKPKGILMAHMHEHKGSINKVCVLPDIRFASCSSDGTVKLWDWGKIERRETNNKSSYTHTLSGGHLMAMEYSTSHGALIVSDDRGMMKVLQIQISEPICSVAKIIDRSEDGYVVDIKTIEDSVIACATLYGKLFGWDLRMKQIPWELESDPLGGAIQCMAVDPSRSFLVTGSSEGRLSCWDLRFQVRCGHGLHPQKRAFCKMLIPPKCTREGYAWASNQYNNEVSKWSLGTLQRSETLWASKAKFDNPAECSPHISSGLCQAEQYIFTAGTDMRIRCWDTKNFASSYIISQPSLDEDRLINRYRSDTSVDGTVVIQEFLLEAKGSHHRTESSMSSRAGTGHQSGITELAIIEGQRNFLISTSRDGVVKVWK